MVYKSLDAYQKLETTFS